MKHIKLFEEIIRKRTYMLGNDMLFINDVMSYLDVDIMPLDEGYKPESPYGVDVMDFFREIFVDKVVLFIPVNNTKKDRSPVPHRLLSLKNKVKSVKYFAYKDEVYIQVKFYYDEFWYLMPNGSGIFVEDYDADTKPLHKEVEMKKVAEKYNI